MTPLVGVVKLTCSSQDRQSQESQDRQSQESQDRPDARWIHRARHVRHTPNERRLQFATVHSCLPYYVIRRVTCYEISIYVHHTFYLRFHVSSMLLSPFALPFNCVASCVASFTFMIDTVRNPFMGSPAVLTPSECSTQTASRCSCWRGVGAALCAVPVRPAPDYA